MNLKFMSNNYVYLLITYMYYIMLHCINLMKILNIKYNVVILIN